MPETQRQSPPDEPAAARLLAARGYGLALAVALVLTAVAYWLAERSERTRIASRFQSRAGVCTTAVLQALQNDFDRLAALADYFEASQQVEMDEFRLIGSRLRGRSQSILSFRWAPLVRDEERASFESVRGAPVLSGYRILDPAPEGARPAARRAEYFPILFAEPELPAPAPQALYGVDLGALTGPWTALHTVRRTGKIAATGLIDAFWLPQQDRTPGLAAFFAPTYTLEPDRGAAPPASERFSGVCVMIVSLDRLLAATLERLPPIRIDCELLQGEPGRDPESLAERRVEAARPRDDGALRFEQSAVLAAQHWTVRCRATPELIAELRTPTPHLVLASGVTVSAALGLYLLAHARGTQALERAVRQRTDELSQSLARLAVSEERFRSMFELASVPMAQVDLQSGRFLATNAAFSQLTGYTPEELRHIRFDQLTHPDDREREQELVRRTSETGASQHFIEKRYVRKDGGVVWVQVNAAIFFDGQRRALRSVAVIQDITERKRAGDDIRRLNEELERRVLERTAQLEAATHELEAFNYSVSHDLRAPLRHASGFASLLLKREHDRLDETSQRYLRTIVDAVQRMDTLIDELLAFSRTSRAQLAPRRVDSAELVESVRRELSEQVPARDIEWRVAELPPVNADPGLMRIVWINLLSNAIKYTGKRQHAAIEIGACRQPDGAVAFHVRDNGAGFDMRFADRLFGVFQRLHRPDDFDGIGIGLATVRRIIHRHGGRVWAEAEPDRGATFYFTLPGDDGNH